MRALLRWFRVYGRELPWRDTGDPWAVWVSEVMLQQTPVARVVPAYESFMARFPTVESLARSPLADALVEWGTLGYPRRARDLWRAAMIVTTELGGTIPSSIEALQELPGIGAYTANAIASFGFGNRSAVPMDINVTRVVRRYAFPAEVQPTRSEVGGAAKEMGAGPLFYQALMDVGATTCRARRADCARCPLVARCASAFADPPPPPPGVRRQAAFEGSRRQARGRVLAALRQRPASAAHFDPEVLAGLAADGLLELHDDLAHLPR